MPRRGAVGTCGWEVLSLSADCRGDSASDVISGLLVTIFMLFNLIFFRVARGPEDRLVDSLLAWPFGRHPSVSSREFLPFITPSSITDSSSFEYIFFLPLPHTCEKGPDQLCQPTNTTPAQVASPNSHTKHPPPFSPLPFAVLTYSIQSPALLFRLP